MPYFCILEPLFLSPRTPSLFVAPNTFPFYRPEPTFCRPERFPFYRPERFPFFFIAPSASLFIAPSASLFIAPSASLFFVAPNTFPFYRPERSSFCLPEASARGLPSSCLPERKRGVSLKHGDFLNIPTPLDFFTNRV